MAAVSDRPRKLRRVETVLLEALPPTYLKVGREVNAYYKMRKQTKMACTDPCGQVAKYRVIDKVHSQATPPSGSEPTSQPEGAQAAGSRPYQEDRLLPTEIVRFERDGRVFEGSLFGILDGHGDGGKGADFVKANLKREFERILTERLKTAKSFEDGVGDAFVQVFDHLAKTYQRPEYRIEGSIGGTTACIGFQFDKKIYIANVGDSRAVLVKKGKFFQVTEDADPDSDRFKTWYERRGIKIERSRVLSPDGKYHMGLARAVGAQAWMCNTPKISIIHIGIGKDDPAEGLLFCEKADRLVFVTDGVTGRKTSAEIAGMTALTKRVKSAAKKIVEQAAAYRGSDNSSVFIVPIRAAWCVGGA
jgi:serine/threonine protein phosphatase PrpC